MLLAICLFTLVIVALSGVLAKGRRIFEARMSPYYSRSCAGRAWRKQFPSASKAAIREFLEIFIEDFCLNHRKKLCFRPDDKLMEVYRTIYPVIPRADEMECESFVLSCEQRYGIDLAPRWSENLTLGEAFELAQARA